MCVGRRLSLAARDCVALYNTALSVRGILTCMYVMALKRAVLLRNRRSLTWQADRETLNLARLSASLHNIPIQLSIVISVCICVKVGWCGEGGYHAEPRVLSVINPPPHRISFFLLLLIGNDQHHPRATCSSQASVPQALCHILHLFGEGPTLSQTLMHVVGTCLLCIQLSSSSVIFSACLGRTGTIPEPPGLRRYHPVVVTSKGGYFGALNTQTGCLTELKNPIYSLKPFSLPSTLQTLQYDLAGRIHYRWHSSRGYRGGHVPNDQVTFRLTRSCSD